MTRPVRPASAMAEVRGTRKGVESLAKRPSFTNWNVLSTYAGEPPGSDFTSTAGNTWQSTGFPTNTTFTKLSSTSLLMVFMNGDGNAGTVPDSVGAAVYFNGNQEQAAFAHLARTNSIFTCAFTSLWGLGGSSGAPLAAGAYTVDLRFWDLVGGGATYMVSGSVELEIVEVEVIV